MHIVAGQEGGGRDREREPRGRLQRPGEFISFLLPARPLSRGLRGRWREMRAPAPRGRFFRGKAHASALGLAVGFRIFFSSS